MSLSSGRASTSNNLGSQDSRISQKKIGVVYDVILDFSHPYATKKGGGSLYTGCIFDKIFEYIYVMMIIFNIIRARCVRRLPPTSLTHLKSMQSVSSGCCRSTTACACVGV